MQPTIIYDYPVETSPLNLQFRAEMFNGLNHVNLNNPNTNVSDKTNFGRISGAAAARAMQLGIKFYF